MQQRCRPRQHARRRGLGRRRIMYAAEQASRGVMPASMLPHVSAPPTATPLCRCREDGGERVACWQVRELAKPLRSAS
jgi:hypothetical protein